MQCPNCLEHFTPSQVTNLLGGDSDLYWWTGGDYCPNEECQRLVVRLLSSGSVSFATRNNASGQASRVPEEVLVETVVYPKGTDRRPVPPEVPAEFAEDYKEACLVLADSPKASAALSRRCLQLVLEKKAGVKPKRLVDEIAEVLSSGNLPQEIADNVDYLRRIGNFGAHANPDKNTGEIVPVEPGEAE